jgi:hypothetical protein
MNIHDPERYVMGFERGRLYIENIMRKKILIDRTAWDYLKIILYVTTPTCDIFNLSN